MLCGVTTCQRVLSSRQKAVLPVEFVRVVFVWSVPVDASPALLLALVRSLAHGFPLALLPFFAFVLSFVLCTVYAALIILVHASPFNVLFHGFRRILKLAYDVIVIVVDKVAQVLDAALAPSHVLVYARLKSGHAFIDEYEYDEDNYKCNVYIHSIPLLT